MGSFERNKYQNSEAMVVSPQPMITDAVTSTLREQSFKQVVALNNGLDAMERARSISPSLILSMSQGRNPLALVGYIRTQEHNRDVWAQGCDIGANGGDKIQSGQIGQ